MKYNHIQKIVIVYGTKDRIKAFLESNVQAIEEEQRRKNKPKGNKKQLSFLV